MADRLWRQQIVSDWCVRSFGIEEASSLAQRGIRFFEESCELTRVTGVSREMAHRMVDYEWDREPGTLEQELGGVGVTILALAEAAGLSADECERHEISRVLNKPSDHFSLRNQAKNDVGFKAS